MKLILGADGRDGDTRVANLIKRLQFSAPESDGCYVDVVNVVESLPFLWMGAPELNSPELIQKLMERQEAEGIAAVSHIADALKGSVTRCRAMTRQGGAVDQLLAHAEDAHADLIAVGGVQESEFAAFLTGSVGRGLVIGAKKQSILVAKGDIAPEGTIKAVFATDHSKYADRCIDTLLAYAPKGIDHLTVVTAYPKEALQSLRPLLPEVVLNPAEWIFKNLEERNQQVIERLKPFGCAFTSVVVDDDPNPVIKKTMRDTQADLLILGARGHGFMERLTLGSVSFHQVIAEPYSVLVLRAQDITN